MNTHAVNWFEIPAADMTRAVKFYETIFAVSLRREMIGDELAIFPSDEAGVGGCVMHSANSQPSADGTVVYLNAEPSIDTVLDRVAKSGGKIVVPKTALPPGMGFFAHIMDTEGNRVGLHAMN
jgi:predicted enzyme related to lactoylglutathione lyase